MVELELQNLNCANCAAQIEESLKTKEYLKDVQFNFTTKKLTLHSELPQEDLKKNIQKEVDKIEEGVYVDWYNSGEIKKTKPFKITKHIPLILGVIILVLAKLSVFSQVINTGLFVMAYLLIGGDIVLRAIKNITKGNVFDENFLMSVATIGAFILGEYTEAVAVMLFYKVGEAFQDYAVDKSRDSIKALLNIKADFANLITNEGIKKVDPSELRLADKIIVKTGEKIPVDGIIREGNSTLDTSALTGESLPSYKTINDEVLSGCINLDSTITIEVTKLFKNSTVARILNLVESATSKKAKTEQFITKFARYYTPFVVFASLAVAIIPSVLGLGSFQEWISRALIFLVISCPCALVLSVPLGYFGGLGAASRKGILIKGGNYLEALNNIDTAVFDKTGTMTKGNFKVVKVEGAKTLEMAALLEQYSTHPIAQSIIKEWEGSLSDHVISDIKEIPGLGMTGILENKELLVGNHRLLESKDIAISEWDKNFPGSVVHVCYGQDYLGSLYIADEIKDNMTNFTSDLRKTGIKSIFMLSGDQKQIAESVGKELGFDGVYSELLPQDKLSILEKIMDDKKKTLFAGDGINDAPVLARADLGVAMGGIGSDVAIEAADIVIMNDDPTKLLDAQSIARKTRRIVMENIIFALLVKTTFLVAGAFGMATMYEAIFADVGVALIAVLNSMRVLKIS
ncbi:heavy metal translocating P-type ATPase [Spirochaeta cellobiosiphila]|uniref:heavy metal translocating P-type ATPase n=1 Tax=Spirochaeta cellobiosiphila TaxID=504483 RepID=UPI00041FDFCF|nr:heavy metal translocating P-type ATPase [Spirochaeta cellobiosiphila]